MFPLCVCVFVCMCVYVFVCVCVCVCVCMCGLLLSPGAEVCSVCTEAGMFAIRARRKVTNILPQYQKLSRELQIYWLDIINKMVAVNILVRYQK